MGSPPTSPLRRHECLRKEKGLQRCSVRIVNIIRVELHAILTLFFFMISRRLYFLYSCFQRLNWFCNTYHNYFFLQNINKYFEKHF